jgi:hypothetical protein
MRASELLGGGFCGRPADCDKEWEDDFTMVAYCREEGSSAGLKVDSLLAAHASAISEGKIVRSWCDNDWGTQYTMVQCCITEQIDAWRSLQQNLALQRDS